MKQHHSFLLLFIVSAMAVAAAVTPERIAAQIIVSGAGDADMNGTYNSCGSFGGKTKYCDGNDVIIWGTGQWLIGEQTLGISTRYNSFCDTPTPPSGSWIDAGGGLPVPTLSGDVDGTLNGTYSVGGGGSPDFATISAAVFALNLLGTCSAVTFEIASGTYDEQTTITTFTRHGDPSDPVTFKPVSTAALVRWDYTGATPGSNFFLKLDGADYIKIEDIQFTRPGTATVVDPGRLIVLEDGADHNIFKDNILFGIVDATADTGTLVYAVGTKNEYNRFENNTFTWGYAGVELVGVGGNRSEGNTFYRNTFTDAYAYGLRSRWQKNAVIDGNSVDDRVNASASSFHGIEADGSATEITNNEIDIFNGEIGIRLQGGGPARRLIANNMIALRGTTGDAGIVLLNGSVDVYHNTVRVLPTSGYALRTNSGIPAVSLKNNILYHDGTGKAMKIASAASMISSDYNNLYTAGDILVDYGDTFYLSLALYQASSLKDSNSVTKTVSFVDATGTNDLHLTGNSVEDIGLAALGLPSVTEDIDGDTRDLLNAYMGADESTLMTPLDNADAPNGLHYRVGGGMPREFTDPEEAINRVNLVGIKGPVTFMIRPGSYNVHATIEDFERHVGAVSARVVFAPSNAGNPPIFTHDAVNGNDNWIIKLDGPHHLTFRNLIFNPTDAAYARAVHVGSGTEDCLFLRLTFNGVPGAGALLRNSALLYGSTNSISRLTIRNSTFYDGGYGIFLSGQGSDSLIVDGNTFYDQEQAAISVASFDRSTIVGNVVERGATAIKLAIMGAVTAVENKMDSVITGFGTITLDAFAEDHSLIANNFCRADTECLRLSSSDSVLVYHNSFAVRGIGAAGSSAAIRAVGGASTNIEMVNNILLNTSGSGYSVYDGITPTPFAVADYNNYYNGTGFHVRVGNTDYTDLATYVAATSLDPNSVSTGVTFADVAAGDLHLTGGSIGDADLSGMPLASVMADFDGDMRSPAVPYMGADEPATPLAIVAEAKILLEGPLSGSLMDTTLKAGGMLPSMQPFNTAPWFYSGSESASTIPSGAVDWVLVDIRTTTFGWSMVGRRAGFVLRNATIVDTTGGPIAYFGVAPGDYHIVLWHRNHIPAMSMTKATLGTTSALYDFTTVGMAYTTGPSPMKDLGGGKYGLFAGDANTDGQITANDFNVWLIDTKAVATGYVLSDFNMDGQVTASDFNQWLVNTKAVAASQVP